MSDPVNPPELIISLSRDKVGLYLLDQPDTGRTAWKSDFPLGSVFIEEHITEALDTALYQNPALIDYFNDVAVVMVDRPNVCVPGFYAGQGNLTEIAGRYLKVRAGDTLSADATSCDTVIAYSVPQAMIRILKEYYQNAGHIHLTSLLWNAIHEFIPPASDGTSRLYFFITGHSLIILGQHAGKLSFSRTFHIQDHADLAYYAVACHQLLRPKENWLLTMKDEPVFFDMPGEAFLTFHHQFELPELHTLIARHRSCVL